MGLNYLVPLLNGLRYQQYYTPLAKIVNSVNAAIVFSELMQRFDYHLTKNELTTLDNIEGWFYHTSEAMEDRLALTRHEQDTGIKILKQFGLVETKLKGVPARRYFKINIEKFAELMNNSKNVCSFADSGKLDFENSATKVAGNRKTIYKDKEPKEEPKKEIRAAAYPLSIIKKEIKKASDPAVTLTKYFQEKLQKSNPKIPNPKNFNNWAIQMDLFLKDTKDTHEEIKQVIDFLYESEHKDAIFWRKNIKSTEKFKEHYPRLWEIFQLAKKMPSKITPTQQQDVSVENDRKYAIELLKPLKKKIDQMLWLKVKLTEIDMLLSDDEKVTTRKLRYGEPQFRENLKRWLKICHVIE